MASNEFRLYSSRRAKVVERTGPLLLPVGDIGLCVAAEPAAPCVVVARCAVVDFDLVLASSVRRSLYSVRWASMWHEPLAVAVIWSITISRRCEALYRRRCTRRTARECCWSSASVHLKLLVSCPDPWTSSAARSGGSGARSGGSVNPFPWLGFRLSIPSRRRYSRMPLSFQVESRPAARLLAIFLSARGYRVEI